MTTISHPKGWASNFFQPKQFINELSPAMGINGEAVREGGGRWHLEFILLPDIYQG